MSVDQGTVGRRAMVIQLRPRSFHQLCRGFLQYLCYSIPLPALALMWEEKLGKNALKCDRSNGSLVASTKLVFFTLTVKVDHHHHHHMDRLSVSGVEE